MTDRRTKAVRTRKRNAKVQARLHTKHSQQAAEQALASIDNALTLGLALMTTPLKPAVMTAIIAQLRIETLAAHCHTKLLAASVGYYAPPSDEH